MMKLDTVKTDRPPAKSLPANHPAALALSRRVTRWLNKQRQARHYTHRDGKLRQVMETQGGSFEYLYDARGNLATIYNDAQSKVHYQYDEKQRLIKVDHSDHTATHFAYNAQNQLHEIRDRGCKHEFEHDQHGRLSTCQHGNAGRIQYRYDSHGRLAKAHSARVSTAYVYQQDGKPTRIVQSVDGIEIPMSLHYNEQGQLQEVSLLGTTQPLIYHWTKRARLSSVHIGDKPIASYTYDDAKKRVSTHFANNLVEISTADLLDGRPSRLTLRRQKESLISHHYHYTDAAQLKQDGQRQFDYDPLERLTRVEDSHSSMTWRYQYDVHDNLLQMEDDRQSWSLQYDRQNRLHFAHNASGEHLQFLHDHFGRLISKQDGQHSWTYRYNDASQLIQVLKNGATVAHFLYDHKDRLVLASFAHHSERYVYGPNDELWAIADANGRVTSQFVHTPQGLVACLQHTDTGTQLRYLHHDHQGTCHLVSDQKGDCFAQFEYTPFGLPLRSNEDRYPARFAGHTWYAALGLSWCGSRWYDPQFARFLTPDSYTAAPDDIRIMHPALPAEQQYLAREHLLGDWLKNPRLRNRYVYCRNDPINRVDPNGHWSFGGVLLSILGAIWTLPNTLFGLLLEVLCLVGEVIRWIVWLLSAGHVSWETPGFDVASSSRLNAFALVFEGGWLGSFPNLLGITFGNIFFANKSWREDPFFFGEGDVYPAAYDGKVAIPRKQGLYEHELRHTNQYGWFGPFFHLGLPIFGVYLWDFLLSGPSYWDMWLERDARAHDGLEWETGIPTPTAPPTPTPTTAPATTRQYAVRCSVNTRAGQIPVRGVKAWVGEQALGPSDTTGHFSVGPYLETPTNLSITAEYENHVEHLKKETINVELSNIDYDTGSFDLRVTNRIEKIQDVAVGTDIDFEAVFPTTDATPEEITAFKNDIQLDLTNQRIDIALRLSSLSLLVPYFNQRSINETINTVAADPEPGTHRIVPEFSGGALCFPSCLHMLLGYWEVTKTVAEIMQQAYQHWADESFTGRLNTTNTTQADTAPANPSNGDRWLDTSTDTDESGYLLKRWKATQNRWRNYADAYWRVRKQLGASWYKVWTLRTYQRQVADEFKPAGTTLQIKVDNTTEPVDLPENIFTSDYTPHMLNHLMAGHPQIYSTTATAGHIMVIRGAVIDHENNVKWLIINDPYGNLASPGSIYEDLDITDSVGQEGVNNNDDVSDVQAVLKAIHFYSGEVNGLCDGDADDDTVKAIKRFQRRKLNMSNPDGLIEPNGMTESRLNRYNFNGYHRSRIDEQERNSNSATGPESMRGKHVYYNPQTQGKNGNLTIKGKYRGTIMLVKDTPFTPAEKAAKLTVGT